MTVAFNVYPSDAGDAFYIINSGNIRVFKKLRFGVELPLSQLGPGESFGEMALLTDKPRSASVETLEETELTVLSKEQLNRILKDYPQVSLQFIKQMSMWLLEDELRLEKEQQQQFWQHGLSPFVFMNLITVLLPSVELICGIFLIIGLRTKAAVSMIGLSLIVFTIAIIINLYRGAPISCGCASPSGEPISSWKVFKNVGMLILTVQVFFFDRIILLRRGGFQFFDREIVF